MFEIDYSKSSKKFLKKLDRKLLLRIFNSIERLKINPIPSDSKLLEEKKMKKFLDIELENIGFFTNLRIKRTQFS